MAMNVKHSLTRWTQRPQKMKIIVCSDVKKTGAANHFIREVGTSELYLKKD